MLFSSFRRKDLKGDKGVTPSPSGLLYQKVRTYFW